VMNMRNTLIFSSLHNTPVIQGQGFPLPSALFQRAKWEIFFPHDQPRKPFKPAFYAFPSPYMAHKPESVFRGTLGK
jgi:hypothetical protein